MRFVSVQQMRAADAAAQTLPETKGMALMLRAGMELARAVEYVARLRETRRVVLVAGHGNNGGDVFVAATGLFMDGFSVQVLMTSLSTDLKGDALSAFKGMKAAKVPFSVCPLEESWNVPEMRAGFFLREGIVVDGILGTGCAGAPRGAPAAAIRWVNAFRDRALVIAADIPSGMNGDTGEVAGDCVTADLTVTFARPKTGFLNLANAWRVGELSVADIGMPDAIAEAHNPPAGLPRFLTSAVPEQNGIAEFIAYPELKKKIPRRPWNANKGTFGKLCIVGGSSAFPHAPVLAAMGALKSGVGLLTLVVPAESKVAASIHAPEAILSGNIQDFSKFDVLVYGPGLGTPGESDRMELRAKRLLIDADGLNRLAKTPGAKPREGEEWILTPHPGEAARLLGTSVAEVQKDRPSAVCALAERYGAVVVLKGAGTLVCSPEGKPWLNLTGNPGMAKGGMGDVLSGLIGGLWAQGMTAFDAACLGVWAHGVAGDVAAWKEGQISMTAQSLVKMLRWE